MSAINHDFIWGAATSAYQIEGAAAADGRTPSIWDQFCRQEGRVLDGATGDVACDHYHRYESDVDLMREIGLQGYRFSISWSRVIPDADGRVNDRGIAFYDSLVDALLDRGIVPFVTLYHWDLPVWAQEKGGWLNREIVDWFGHYTQVLAEHLSDRVQHWFTLNEPQCFLGLGLEKGEHAPGYRLTWPELLRASHHSLLAHGRAVTILREHARSTPAIGAAPTGSGVYPLVENPENIAQAAKATFRAEERTLWNFAWFTDPMMLGQYPEDGLRTFGECLPKGWERDLKTIAAPLDFCGLNLYNGWQINEMGEGVARPAGAPLTALKWPVTPEVLYWTPRFFEERYGLPVYITENGCSTMDWLDSSDEVPDYGRIDFHHRYLAQLRRAVDEGVDVRGYFLWSLMDNFEWAHGYRERFGLIHVDYSTQKRTLKRSAHWYRDFISRQTGLNAADAAETLVRSR